MTIFNCTNRSNKLIINTRKHLISEILHTNVMKESAVINTNILATCKPFILMIKISKSGLYNIRSEI